MERNNEPRQNDFSECFSNFVFFDFEKISGFENCWNLSKFMNFLDKQFLVGHSLGAYVSGGYVIRYPERVSRVYFCDPWGWSTFDPKIAAYTYNERPFFQEKIGKYHFIVLL